MTNDSNPAPGTCRLPDGTHLPRLGLGTWRMGEQRAAQAREVAAVREAIALGYRLIDTAEMYGEGGAERVVGEAVAGAIRAGEVRREELCIVSKVYPHHASAQGTPAACDRSRARLGLDRIDLYLLHWRGEVPLQETCAAMHALVAAGHIGRWGVSNFDTDDMDELQALEDRMLGAPAPAAAGAGQGRCVLNQVYYSLSSRGPEFSLLPWLRARSMPLMAYSPIDQGALCAEPALLALARERGIGAAQLALAWVLAQQGVMAIPKAVRPAHLRENLAAAATVLDVAVLAQLDRFFAPPRRKAPLAVL